MASSNSSEFINNSMYVVRQYSPGYAAELTYQLKQLFAHWANDILEVHKNGDDHEQE
jgi:hypothetical protein